MIQLNGHDVTTDELSGLALYSYGHFTSMRVEAMSVRGLSMHLARLDNDAQTLFGVNLDLEKVRHLIRSAALRFTGPEIMRVTVFDPNLELGHPGAAHEPQILITNRPVASSVPAPLNVVTTEYRRRVPTVKHVGLFDSIRTRRIAQLDGYDDVLFVGVDGNISEGATWNVAFFDGTQVVWPKADVLPGVTMRLLVKAAGEAGIVSITSPLSIESTSRMEAAFATNIAVGVRPIGSINDRNFPVDAPILNRLQTAYESTPWEPI